MQVQTKFLRLFREVFGDRIDGWRVCWIGGWEAPGTVGGYGRKAKAIRPDAIARRAVQAQD